MRMLAYAVAIPAHARVNTLCQPVWNEDKSDLKLVWRGQTYAHGFHAFNVQPDTKANTCTQDGCVERLFCTDSGVAGWYNASVGEDDRYRGSNRLEAVWLGHAATVYSGALRVEGTDGTFTWSSWHGPGTVAVAGDTLFYFASSNASDRLPRLSSLVFAPWAPGRSGAQLVHEGLRALDVLGYRGSFLWAGYFSPLYPSGPDAVTLSAEDWYGSDWAIDAAVASGRVAALVHYLPADFPSAATASREVATFPGLSCRALPAGGAQCARVGGGQWTWADAATRAMGRAFAPLAARFVLPSALWLQRDVAFDRRPYRALLGFGHAPVIAYAGGALLLPETRADDACDSGRVVVLARYRLGAGLEPLGSTRLACARTLAVPAAYVLDPSYGALALKWMPWGGQSVFVAQDLAAGEYERVDLPLQ